MAELFQSRPPRVVAGVLARPRVGGNAKIDLAIPQAATSGTAATGRARSGEVIAAASWGCWALPLLFTERVLQGRKRSSRPSAFRLLREEDSQRKRQTEDPEDAGLNHRARVRAYAFVNIIRIESDDEILSTFDVMLQLRPHLRADDYLPTVRRMMKSDGYRLAAASDGRTVTAVAGYRLMEMLYCGRLLYVDDLVSDETARSAGYGHALIEWLKNEARANGCAELHLDSGVQRKDAHRFYFRERFTITGYHFTTPLA